MLAITKAESSNWLRWNARIRGKVWSTGQDASANDRFVDAASPRGRDLTGESNGISALVVCAVAQC
jgi:hypothetical protein